MLSNELNIKPPAALGVYSITSSPLIALGVNPLSYSCTVFLLIYPVIVTFITASFLI